MHIFLAAMQIDGTVSPAAAQRAAQAARVVVQTALPGFALPNGVAYETLDSLFDSAADFEELLKSCVDAVMQDGTLFFALGSLAHSDIAIAAAYETIHSGGSVTATDEDAAICLAVESGMLRRAGGVSAHTAASLKRISDTDMLQIVHGLDSRIKASRAKMIFAECYSDEHEVLFCDTAARTAKKLPLFEIDQQAEYGYQTAIVLPPVPLGQKCRYTFADLLNVMDRLRAPGGCPWDREQTHESLKRYLVEESYEVLEAIDAGDTTALFDELGDVLLQVVFHAKIGQQSGEFDISDVLSAICEKMISRHTHIFGSAVAHTPDDVVKNWEQIKREEKGHESQTDVLKGVPKSMPALMRSGKVQHKAAHVGFDFRKVGEALAKLHEEIREVQQDMQAGKDVWEESGDLLFAAVNVVRLLGVEPELALQKATDKFIARFEKVEKIAFEKKIDMRTCSVAVLDEIWKKAKEDA